MWPEIILLCKRIIFNLKYRNNISFSNANIFNIFSGGSLLPGHTVLLHYFFWGGGRGESGPNYEKTLMTIVFFISSYCWKVLDKPTTFYSFYPEIYKEKSMNKWTFYMFKSELRVADFTRSGSRSDPPGQIPDPVKKTVLFHFVFL